MNANMMMGSLSHGTLKTDDLLSTFADALADLDTDKRYSDLIAECRFYSEALAEDRLNDVGIEHADYLLNEDLFEALNDFAPPYFYFGAHPGDGADFGFWLSEDVQQDVKDSGGIVIADLADLPSDYTGEALLVNDHGNATLYTVECGRYSEVWAVV